MLYLVPTHNDRSPSMRVCSTLFLNGVRALYMPPRMSIVHGTHPLSHSVRKSGNTFLRELCYNLLVSGQCANVTQNFLKQYGMTRNMVDGYMPDIDETTEEYAQRVRSWFTDVFMDRLKTSPIPTAIVADYDVCMTIAEYLAKHQMNRAILPHIPGRMRQHDAMLEYQNSGFGLEATRFL